MATTQGGKKGRKIGHNKTRSISMANYNAQMRWERNKRKSVEREKKLQDLHAQVRLAFPNRTDIGRATREFKRNSL